MLPTHKLQRPFSGRGMHSSAAGCFVLSVSLTRLAEILGMSSGSNMVLSREVALSVVWRAALAKACLGNTQIRVHCKMGID